MAGYIEPHLKDIGNRHSLPPDNRTEDRFSMLGYPEINIRSPFGILYG